MDSSNSRIVSILNNMRVLSRAAPNLYCSKGIFVSVRLMPNDIARACLLFESRLIGTNRKDHVGNMRNYCTPP